MAAMTTRSLVTNHEVAQDLDITHSAVSRIRSGDRFPSVGLMVRICDLLDWSVEAQARLLGSAQYSAAFESRLASHYDE